MAGGIGTCLMTMGLICNISFYFVAQNTHSCDLFSGKVVDNLRNGHAVTRFFFPNGAACNGNSYVSYYPPGGGCAGQQGKVYNTCSDGRTIKGEWTVTSPTCKVGYGTASDSYGNDYDFTFGYTAKQAIQRVNILREQLGCPPINLNGVKMEVQGKILRMD